MENKPKQDPLYSAETERALLGAIFIEPNKFESINNEITSEVFADPINQKIFMAMCAVDNRGENIDVFNVNQELEIKSNNYIDLAFLLQIQRETPNTINTLQYCYILRDKLNARKLNNLCKAIQDKIQDPKGLHIKDITTYAENAMFKLTQEAVQTENPTESAKEIYPRVIEHLYSEKDKKKAVSGLPSGFIDLDRKTSGFHNGELVIIGARPAMGKTTLLMNMAEYITYKTDERPVLIFSLEMSKEQLITRSCSSLGHILTSHTLTPKDMTPEEWGQLATLAPQFADNNKQFYINDSSELSPVELRNIAKRLYNEVGGLSCIMIDYLQLLSAKGFKDNRQLEIGYISRNLKALAKELNIPVIALAQLNRSLEERKDKTPTCADLRESGQIEQDADLILFLTRPEVYAPTDASLKGIAQIHIGKNRRGDTGMINLFFDGPHSKFENIKLQN